ncbi:MAG: hypothetical protein M5U35_09670 [Roseovarius sp.]|nr:hypothetical protein [Roseovarius sp.]
MFWHDLKLHLQEFRDDERGSFIVEAVIALPILFWGLAATFEFFEVHRFKSVREKATYTIADMLSREQDVVTEVYMDNAKALLDVIASDDGVNQLRVSVVRFLANDRGIPCCVVQGARHRTAGRAQRCRRRRRSRPAADHGRRRGSDPGGNGVAIRFALRDGVQGRIQYRDPRLYQHPFRTAALFRRLQLLSRPRPLTRPGIRAACRPAAWR